MRRGRAAAAAATWGRHREARLLAPSHQLSAARLVDSGVAGHIVRKPQSGIIKKTPLLPFPPHFLIEHKHPKPKSNELFRPIRGSKALEVHVHAFLSRCCCSGPPLFLRRSIQRVLAFLLFCRGSRQGKGRSQRGSFSLCFPPPEEKIKKTILTQKNSGKSNGRPGLMNCVPTAGCVFPCFSFLPLLFCALTVAGLLIIIRVPQIALYNGNGILEDQVSARCGDSNFH